MGFWNFISGTIFLLDFFIALVKNDIMKNTLYYIAIFTLIALINVPLCGLSQSMILAGQTEGDYIHYTDYEPDSLVELWDTYNYFDLDIDHDGIIDLGFYVQGEYLTSIYYEFRADVEMYYDDVEIVLSNYNLAKNLSFGDTINVSMNWSGNNISPVLRRYYYNFYPPPGNGAYYGEFDSGYLGFKIENDWETYYGWIELEVFVDNYGLGTFIQAKSMAFYSQTVGLENLTKSTNNITIFPNPCKGQFTLNIPETDFKERNFKIFNAFGGQLMTGIFEGSTVDVDAGNLHPGVYFVEVSEASKPVYRGKIIVQ